MNPISHARSFLERREATLPPSPAPIAELSQWAWDCKIPLWEFSDILPRGRMTSALSMLRFAQSRGEHCVWIQGDHGGLFPPDLAEAGIDLDSLVVLNIPPSSGNLGLLKSTEILLRSQAFRLIVLDLSSFHGQVFRGNPCVWQRRFIQAAEAHHARILLLSSSDPDQPSSGALINIRIHPQFRAQHGHSYQLEHTIIKNKCGVTLSDQHIENYRAPWGIPQP